MRRRLTALALAAALCLALCACAAGEDPYPLSAQRIREDTEYLCLTIGDRPTGTDKERQACDWLQDQLEQAGFSTRDGTLSRVEFQGFKEMRSENLIAVCNPGAGTILCVMAHYDTVEGTPGARDNTSSVATLLEIARYLGPRREELRAEVRLLFLGSEENGYHGATAYVRSLSEEERQLHLAAFNMENSAASPGPGAQLVCGTLGGVVDGSYREGDFLEPIPNLASNAVSDAWERYYGEQPLPVFHFGMSDHISFHQAQIPAVNLTWRFFHKDGRPRVPDEYHLPTDTPDGMGFDEAVITGSCILEALFRLSEEQGLALQG